MDELPDEEMDSSLASTAAAMRERSVARGLEPSTEAWFAPVRMHTSALSEALGVDWDEYISSGEVVASEPAPAPASVSPAAKGTWTPKLSARRATPALSLNSSRSSPSPSARSGTHSARSGTHSARSGVFSARGAKDGAREPMTHSASILSARLERHVKAASARVKQDSRRATDGSGRSPWKGTLSSSAVGGGSTPKRNENIPHNQRDPPISPNPTIPKVSRLRPTPSSYATKAAAQPLPHEEDLAALD